MKQVDIAVQKTARYYIDGQLSDKTKSVWIVCHGYAQLAKYFIKPFKSIVDEETVVIAPERITSILLGRV